MTAAEQVYEQAKLVPDAWRRRRSLSCCSYAPVPLAAVWDNEEDGRPGTIFGVAATLTSALDSDLS